MLCIRPCLLLCMLACLPATTIRASIVSYFDDSAYLEAAGTVHIINFADLPDGSPAYHDAAITDEWNYEAAGAHFGSPGDLRLLLRETGDFALRTEVSAPQQAWIDIALTNPASAVAIFFDDQTTMSLFDVSGVLLAVIHPPVEPLQPRHENHPGFMGVVSGTPIGSLRVARGHYHEAIHGFLFTPVPEPASICLVAFAVGAALPKRKRRSRS